MAKNNSRPARKKSAKRPMHVMKGGLGDTIENVIERRVRKEEQAKNRAKGSGGRSGAAKRKRAAKKK